MVRLRHRRGQRATRRVRVFPALPTPPRRVAHPTLQVCRVPRSSLHTRAGQSRRASRPRPAQRVANHPVIVRDANVQPLRVRIAGQVNVHQDGRCLRRCAAYTIDQDRDPTSFVLLSKSVRQILLCGGQALGGLSVELDYSPSSISGRLASISLILDTISLWPIMVAASRLLPRTCRAARA